MTKTLELATLSPHVRQAPLRVEFNPHTTSEYVVTLSEDILCQHGPATLSVRFIPDEWVLPSTALPEYLAQFKSRAFSLEALAATIIEDFNNTLIPRWVHVSLVQTIGKRHHRVTLEDRQPQWKNPDLMARLERI